MSGGTTFYRPVRLLRRLMADTSGASMIEYGLLISLLAVALAFSFSFFGESVTHVIDSSGVILDDVGTVEKNPAASDS